MTTLLLPRTSDTATSLSSEQVIELLDAPATAPGWIPLHEPRELSDCLIHLTEDMPQTKSVEQSRRTLPCETHRSVASFTSDVLMTCLLLAVPQDDPTLFSNAVKSACESVIKAEPEITRYDTSKSSGVTVTFEWRLPCSVS